MLNPTHLRTTKYFVYQDTPYQVLKYKHTHLSRRSADIKVKARNLVTGQTKNFSFGSSERFKEAAVEKKMMQFLYKQDNHFYFMDPQTFKQIEVAGGVVGEKAKFLKDGQEVELLFWQDRPLDVNLPTSVVLAVAKTAPGVKGDSATNVYKPAVLENGLKLKVPLFIESGDRVKVDTRTEEYLARSKKNT